jgi:3-deoxy-D-manno-octulosonic acid kinase
MPPMSTRTINLDSGVIVYDAGLFSRAEVTPGPEWFSPPWWEEQGLVESQKSGRGSALVLDTPVGKVVLRQYLRGGWAAKVVHSRYFFTGYGNSRPLMEFEVLGRAVELDLPVPKPVAAVCHRHGLGYSGALMTMEIRDAVPLERVMGRMSPESWRDVGACIRKFHDHGIVHIDLTVRNILYQEGGGFFIIDFDRARIRPGARRAFSANLKRLRRSLEKEWTESMGNMEQLAWTQLLQGYEFSNPAG